MSNDRPRRRTVVRRRSRRSPPSRKNARTCRTEARKQLLAVPTNPGSVGYDPLGVPDRSQTLVRAWPLSHTSRTSLQSGSVPRRFQCSNKRGALDGIRRHGGPLQRIGATDWVGSGHA